MITINKLNDDSLMVELTIKKATLADADAFRDELIALFDQYHKKIILSMAQVEYIDSSFLGALVVALKHFMASKSDLILVDMHKDIANLFELIRLNKVFKIYNTFNDVPVV